MFLFKQKTADEMRISDWSSDVCSSDLVDQQQLAVHALVQAPPAAGRGQHVLRVVDVRPSQHRVVDAQFEVAVRAGQRSQGVDVLERGELVDQHPHAHPAPGGDQQFVEHQVAGVVLRSEEHTSELQSLLRISYAVFCLKKKTQKYTTVAQF